MKKFREINEVLYECCQLELKQPLPDKHLTLMTVASFQASGYAVPTEDDPNQTSMSARKNCSPVANGQKAFNPSQEKLSIYAKEYRAIFLAFKEFGHIFWETPNPVIIMTGLFNRCQLF